MLTVLAVEPDGPPLDSAPVGVGGVELQSPGEGGKSPTVNAS